MNLPSILVETRVFDKYLAIFVDYKFFYKKSVYKQPSTRQPSLKCKTLLEIQRKC